MRVMARTHHGGTIYLHWKAEPEGKRQRMLTATPAEFLDYGLLRGLRAKLDLRATRRDLLRGSAPRYRLGETSEGRISASLGRSGRELRRQATLGRTRAGRWDCLAVGVWGRRRRCRARPLDAAKDSRGTSRSGSIPLGNLAARTRGSPSAWLAGYPLGILDGAPQGAAPA